MASNEKPFLVIGEILFDIKPGEQPILGGASTNFAFHLANQGIPVRLVSRVGKDGLGDIALEKLSAAGVDISLVQRADGERTGIVNVDTSVPAAPKYEIVRDVAYDRLELNDHIVAAAQEAPAIYFGTIIQRTEDSSRVIKDIIKVSPRVSNGYIDLNLRDHCYFVSTIQRSLNFAKTLKLSVEEIEIVASQLQLPYGSEDRLGFCKEIFHQYMPQNIVISLGANGIEGYDINGNFAYDPGYQVPVVDGIGAGDASFAVITAKLLAGIPLQQAIEAGNRMGALVVTKSGGMPEVSQREIDLLDAPRVVEPPIWMARKPDLKSLEQALEQSKEVAQPKIEIVR